MKKQLLILTIGASFLLASSNEVDLLSKVTNNSVNGAQYELNNQDMEKVDGGYTSFSSPVPQVFYGSIANQMNGLLSNSKPIISNSSSNTTTNRVSNIVTSGSNPTFVTQSQINSGRF